MNNYVLLYYFKDKDVEQKFEQEVQKLFWRHQVDTTGNFKYFGFADYEEPAVVDKLDRILNGMGIGTDGFFGQTDYVAIYFTREKDPDNIKRQLLIGTEDMVDKDAESTSIDAHQSSITNLLNFDYVKAFPEPPGK